MTGAQPIPVTERSPNPAKMCAAGFTLIELLIVIGLLGALAVLVMPSLTADKKWALDESLAPKEMMDIRRAYAKFAADCCPTAADKTLIGQYGLEVLVKYNDSRGWSFPASFDQAKGKGWRGPYIGQEGTRSVNVASPGQPIAASGGTEIPVIADPRSGSHTDVRYYRILYEATNRQLAIVYVGEDGVLNASAAASPAGGSFTDSFPEEYYGDDTVRALSME